MSETKEAQGPSLDQMRELLSKMDPAQLAAMNREIQAEVKKNNDALTEQKSAFMGEVAKLFENAKLTPPEQCRVTLSFDSEGKVTEKRYTSGSGGKSGGGGGNGGTGATPTPKAGTTAYRTHQGKEHSLLIAGENDFVLNGKDHFNSPTAAAKAAKGSDVAINGAKWWFVQGRLEDPKR